jgi:hypothetical protein
MSDLRERAAEEAAGPSTYRSQPTEDELLERNRAVAVAELERWATHYEESAHFHRAADEFRSAQDESERGDICRKAANLLRNYGTLPPPEEAAGPDVAGWLVQRTLEHHDRLHHGGAASECGAISCKFGLTLAGEQSRAHPRSEPGAGMQAEREAIAESFDRWVAVAREKGIDGVMIQAVASGAERVRRGDFRPKGGKHE